MSKDKRFFIEGIDLEGLQQIMDKSYLKAMEQIKEEIQSSIDPYAHIPEKLSTTEVKKYFSLSPYKLNQLSKQGILNRINIGFGDSKPTWKYYKSELIEYVNSQKK